MVQDVNSTQVAANEVLSDHVYAYDSETKEIYRADKEAEHLKEKEAAREEKGEKGGRKLEAKAGIGLYMALLLFVGIPLPGTGAWTGTLAASLLDLDFKKSVLYILFGLLLAAAIMLAISLGVFGAISLVK